MMVILEVPDPQLPTGLNGETERLFAALLLATLNVDVVVGEAGTDFVFVFGLIESKYLVAYDWMSLARDAKRLSDDFELDVAQESSLPPPSSSLLSNKLEDPFRRERTISCFPF